MKNKQFLQWLPGIVSEVLAVIFCILYAVIKGHEFTMYLALIGSALLPFLVPIYGVVSKKPLPGILSIAFAVFVFFSCDLGSAAGLYDRFFYWDLLMHGIFGFICSLTIFTLLVRWNGSKLNPIGFMVLIFVFTMGIAAIWEILEYITDLMTGGDAQRVAESVALGKSPVADTMEDMIVAIAGIAVFYITLVIDKFSNYKLYSRLCGFNGFDGTKVS